MVIDGILALVAITGFILGFSRGIIRWIFTILSYTFGAMAALRFARPVTDFLKDVLDQDSPFMFILGFLLTFLLTMLLLRLISRGLEGILKTANINIINQVIGGAVVSSVMVLLYSGVLWFILSASFNEQERKNVTQDSQTYSFLKEYPSLVWKYLGKARPIISDFWDYSKDILDQVENMTERAESKNYFFEIEDEAAPRDTIR